MLKIMDLLSKEIKESPLHPERFNFNKSIFESENNGMFILKIKGNLVIERKCTSDFR